MSGAVGDRTVGPAGVGRSFSAKSRATPLSSRGEPMVWLTGAALALCGLMVVALLATVVAGGVRAFWPRAIELVTYRPAFGSTLASGSVERAGGEVFLGSVVRTESYLPSPEERAAIDSLAAAGKLPAGSRDEKGLPIRRLYKTGNKEFRSQPFVWVPVWQIVSSTIEPAATQLERSEWGVWHGYPKAVVRERVVTVTGPREGIRLTEGEAGGGQRVERQIRRELPGGKLEVVERTIFDASPELAMAKFREQHPLALARKAEIERLKSGAVGDVNGQIEHERLRVRQAELLLGRQQSGADGGLLTGELSRARGVVVVVAIVVAVVCVCFGLRRLTRRRAVEVGFLPPPDPRGTLIGVSLLALGVVLGLLAWVENPFGTARMTPEGLAEVRSRADSRTAELRGEYERIMADVAAVDADDAEWRVLFVEPSTGRFAPVRQTEPESALRLSQVVRAVQPNEMGWWTKLGVYLDRWGEFLFDVPREANTEGGVFPVIFGTVTLTLLLSVVVVPLGVIAALYLREYAKQGPLTSALRIAINNLAGVPSIVYGVFGLGFFCYTVGQYVDTGSGVLASEPATLFGTALPMRAVVFWWLGVLSLAVLVVGAVLVGGWSRPMPGKRATGSQEHLAKLAFGGWCLAALGALALVAYTPYFRGFFEARGPAPTFAAKGMLWSACTLALLTLPVVIVATEEAIAAVPRSMREGSYGCGASKWQTIQRIVLPRAMPGIMTGMILAMARGAGEVAPLMLVGAVKLAPDLPLDTRAPFVHLDRPFMHLGFHIYDVGFQSPDAEAARPVVWCTTFLLIVVVVALNITAIRVRAGLRKRFMGEAF